MLNVSILISLLGWLKVKNTRQEKVPYYHQCTDCQGEKNLVSMNEIWFLVTIWIESELQCLKYLCQQTPKKSGARGWVAFFFVEASQIKNSLIHKFGLDWVKLAQNSKIWVFCFTKEVNS